MSIFEVPSIQVAERLGQAPSYYHRHSIEQYWSSQTELTPRQRIYQALHAAGIDLCMLTIDLAPILSPLDEFHCLGAESTSYLAQALELRGNDHLLDVGCGIGGPSRNIAINFGCSVTGVDITKGYCDAAIDITKKMGIPNSLLNYYHADALDLPFPDSCFDAVLIQVAATNIVNRNQLYSEISRVLKPGGRAGILDIFSAGADPLDFPVPWAWDESTSALFTQDATLELLDQQGLRVRQVLDMTPQAFAWYKQQASTTLDPNGPPPIGFHILLPEWAVMASNQAENIAAQRVTVGHLVLEKTS